MTFTKQHSKATYIIFLILFGMRIIVPMTDFAYGLLLGSKTWIAILVNWFGENVMAPWIFPSYVQLSPILISIAIILNRENLSAMNIDKFFVALFVYSGLIISWDFFLPLGWLSGVGSLYVLVYLITNQMVFEKNDPTLKRFLLALISFACATIICFISSNNLINNTKLVFSALHDFSFSTAIYEEVIFRGMLWMFLKNKAWADSKIVVVQAILFWLAHLPYILVNPFSFFMVFLLLGFFLGYLVLRTNSLAVSAIAHTFYNLIILVIP